ncbi:MFS transporter [Stackebrandtia nassauensis]|uniref:Drug resistance transporter, EmrB/QacA subfamily n=1 Tax=Stackebrandtia nassauensis (strain DSM 44728 / CIP 108903 / NRRL B-16338 / NBRC 102104 / LLR-40K-21) TaxID=446470 RepID=D3Q9T3_STANL|nr:MFS transporter [Stackebrandtia nassauensis]ADD44629.1 drug resistance transporter, EmrB/QacA subfamily [Stackebrandtia nassauensis DSM 44728]
MPQQASPTLPETGHPRRWFILSALVLSLIVVVLDNTVLNVAMKVIADPKEGLGANQAELEWSINSYTLVFAGLLFTFGVIGDRIGRKRMLLAGLVLFGLTSVASAFAQNPEQLIWARAGMGIGAAAIMPATLSILTNVFAPKDRGRAIGIWSGAVGIGIAIGPIIGGALLEQFWWGSVFLINAPVVIIALLAIGFVAPESRNPNKVPLDFGGVILSILGLVSLTYGIIEGGETGDWGQIGVWGPTAFGVVVLAAFVLYERRIAHPALDVRLFKERRFASASAVISLLFFAAMGLMFFMTFYIQIIKGLSPLETGLMFLPFAGAMLIFSPLSAGMVKRFGPKVVATAGMTAITAAFAGYILLDADTPLWVMAVMFFVQGSGMANVMPPAMDTIMGSVPREKSGVGSAVGNTLRQVGGSLGVAVLGSVLSQLYRDDISGKIPAGLETGDVDPAESIASTYGVAQQMGPAGRELMNSATDSFIAAMHTTAIVSALVGLAGIIVAVTLFPRRNATPAAPQQRESDDKAPQPALVDA